MNIKTHLYSLAVFSGLTITSGSFAADWKVTPEVSLREVYSDNILLSANNEESDLITEITPRLVVVADGNRLDLQLDYSLQNLSYLDNSERNNSNHRLNSKLKTELVENLFYFDAAANVSQQLANIREGVSRDRISGSQNYEDVYGYSFSPSFTPRLGRFLQSKFSYTYDYLDSANDNETNSLNYRDSEGDHFNASISNGEVSGKFFWDLSHNSRSVEYGNGDKTETELSRATLGFQLNRTWAINLSGTEENNEFVGDRGNNNPDDSFYGAGVTWTPTRNFSLTLGYNERSDPRPGEDENFGSGKLSWKPTSRTDLSAEYGNRFFGETYDFKFSHRTRRTSSQINYSESITDFREQVLDQELLGSLVCPIGANDLQQCRIFDPSNPPALDEQTLDVFGVASSISNNTYINKRLNASWSITGGKNVITLSARNNQRKYLGDGDNERELDIVVTWSYQLAPRTVSQLRIEQGEQRYDNNDESEDLSVRWSLATNVSAKSKVSFELYYTDRDADVRANGYAESRATLTLNHLF